MPAAIDRASLFLFVPADRPERFAKAVAAGADCVIVDLEDAVAPHAKETARAGLPGALAGLATAVPLFLRINGVATGWHADDMEMAGRLPIAGLVLPKTETAADLGRVRLRLAEGQTIVALVESVRGLADIDEIATAADRVAFGSVDFAADLGCTHSRDALLLARSRIVMASRLAGRPAPIDGVTLSIRDEPVIEGDSRYAMALGFSGKLLIHPAQVTPARRGFLPGRDEIAWAERVVESAADGAARAVDGAMVDAPVLARAQQILRSSDRYTNG